jgi:hypothetical protein
MRKLWVIIGIALGMAVYSQAKAQDELDGADGLQAWYCPATHSAAYAPASKAAHVSEAKLEKIEENAVFLSSGAPVSGRCDCQQVAVKDGIHNTYYIDMEIFQALSEDDQQRVFEDLASGALAAQSSDEQAARQCRTLKQASLSKN